MLYCLDGFDRLGRPGCAGTSHTAMLFLSHWLTGYGEVSDLPLVTQYVTGRRVNMHADGLVLDALHRRGVAVVRLWLEEVEHYVLLTGESEGRVLMFDPYYATKVDAPEVEVTFAEPFAYNRIVSATLFERESQETYALGPGEAREAVLLFNTSTRLTAEKTIEYFI
nr:peptidase C39 [Mitsuokella multacida]